MSAVFYKKLYQLQDAVLNHVRQSQTEFYLTGGTALSRCYLNHRYSDDLDFFLDFSPDFEKQASAIKKILNAEYGERFKIQIDQDFFKRLFVADDSGLKLKIELINDVPYRVGELQQHELFPRVDHWQNILTNKICALSRNEPKDWIDILFIACHYPFNWIEMIEAAKEKDDWVEEIKVASYLNDIEIISGVNFVDDQNEEELIDELHDIAKDILRGEDNLPG